MNGFTPQAIWASIRRARLVRVLVLYLTSAFVVLQAVDILVDRLALPDWFFPGALVLLLVGLPIIVATALVQSTPDPTTSATPTSQQPAAGGDPGEPEDAARVVAATADDGSESDPARPMPEPRVPLGADTTFTDVLRVAKHWLTWHRAIAGGIAAFTVLILAVAGYTGMRALGIGPMGSLVAAGVLDARERILIAEFESQTGDTLLAGVVTEAFRVDFSQSPIVRVVEPGFVRDVLARMERNPASRLTYPLAREVALRDGINAVVAGEIGTVGTGYVISARLLAPGSDEVLAAFRETAAGDDQLIPAIDRLSKRLRERIGESLRTIRANPPLAQVTTPSLEALSKYTQALDAIDVRGQSDRGLALLEEAIALDTAFAMAYRKLAVELRNRWMEPARRIDALERAHRHLDRLTERERYVTAGTYYYEAGDVDAAILAYRNLLELEPDNRVGLNNLGVLYGHLQDWRRAEEYYRLAFATDTLSPLALGNQVAAIANQGRFEEAEVLAAEVARRFPDHPQAQRDPALVSIARRDYVAAESLFVRMADRHRGTPAAAFAQASLASAVAIHGRLRQSERWSRAVLEDHERRGRAPSYIGQAAWMAARRIMLLRDLDGGLQILRDALDRFPLEAIEPYDRPHLDLAATYALAGRPDLVGSIVASFDAELGHMDYRSVRNERRELAVFQALAEERFRDAIRAAREVDPGNCSICYHDVTAIAFDGLGEPDSAIAAYRAYVDTPLVFRHNFDALFLGLFYERLYELYEQTGDREQAAEFASRLVELWRDADPELQPRVRAAERTLQRLAADRPPG